jgi:peptide/nickel transport system ATP-binding protein
VTGAPAAVRVEGLRVEVAATGDDIVAEVQLQIAAGDVLALVGESGSGKTTAALALLGHQRRGARITAGRVLIGDQDMLALSAGARRAARGRVVSYVPQDPGAALNPARRIGAHLLEALEVHDYGGSGAARRERVAEMMREVSLPDDEAFLRRYPHELSGGQQQRVTIAMAFACKPAVVVLDEPTTGLDVTTQAHVLRTVRRITRLEGAAALYVSHDLSVVGSFADRVAVMYAGRLIEEGPAADVFAGAAHPYTRMLLAAVPRLDSPRALTAIPGRAPAPGTRPPGCPFAGRCTVHVPECDAGLPPEVPAGPAHTARCIRIQHARTAIAITTTRLPAPDGEAAADVLRVEHLSAAYGPSPVVHDVGFTLGERECLALVGESGSGKTTVARCVAGLHAQWTGEVALGGATLPSASRGRTRSAKRDIQYIFQNPYGSLNPRRSVGQSVARPLSLLDVPRREAGRQVGEMLERVSLPASYAAKYPDELSGGERQRVAIARALICRPRVLLCDEVTSALDVSVQASIVTLLRTLQDDLGLSILFVTHNLPLVRSIAQRVVVLQHGAIVEAGEVGRVLDRPQADYTRQLLADAPRLDTAAVT